MWLRFLIHFIKYVWWYHTANIDQVPESHSKELLFISFAFIRGVWVVKTLFSDVASNVTPRICYSFDKSSKFQTITPFSQLKIFYENHSIWMLNKKNNIISYLTHSRGRDVLTPLYNIPLLSTCLCNILWLSNICILCVVHDLYLPGEIINCFIVSPQGTKMLGLISSCVHGVMIMVEQIMWSK